MLKLGTLIRFLALQFQSLWQVVASVIHLGDISFIEVDNHVTIADQRPVTTLAKVRGHSRMSVVSDTKQTDEITG